MWKKIVKACEVHSWKNEFQDELKWGIKLERMEEVVWFGGKEGGGNGSRFSHEENYSKQQGDMKTNK